MKVAMVTIAHCAGEVVQMVKCLSCKHEDLNLILSPHVQHPIVMYTYLELLVLQRWRQDHHGVLNAEHQDNTRDSNSKIKVTDSNYPLVN